VESRHVVGSSDLPESEHAACVAIGHEIVKPGRRSDVNKEMVANGDHPTHMTHAEESRTPNTFWPRNALQLCKPPT
jgi:hypothetical protein